MPWEARVDGFVLFLVLLLVIAALAAGLVAMQLRRRRGGVLGTGRNK